MIGAIQQVFDMPEDALQPTTRLVAIALADNVGSTDGATPEAWPSNAHLRAKTGLSERTIRTHLKLLADAGVITIITQGGGRPGTPHEQRPNLYLWHPDKATWNTPQDAQEPQEQPDDGTLLPEPTRAPASARSRPRTRLPEGWEPTRTHRRAATADGLDIDREAATFRAHAEANDRRCASWDAAFTQWLLKARPPAHHQARHSGGSAYRAVGARLAAAGGGGT